jgi:hypothetical protein
LSEENEVSIGRLFDQVDEVRIDSLRVGKLTTEVYEKQIAGQIHDLADVVADVVYLLRDHLSCHDCKVVDHEHLDASAVERVLDGVVERVDE